MRLYIFVDHYIGRMYCEFVDSKSHQ